jgi:hypothetical protein
MKSRDELLESLASARSLAQSYLSWGNANLHAYLSPRIPKVVLMLDMMEARVRAEPEMLEPSAFDDIPLGLYAVRELDQIDGDKLATALCHIQHALKRPLIAE